MRLTFRKVSPVHYVIHNGLKVVGKFEYDFDIAKWKLSKTIGEDVVAFWEFVKLQELKNLVYVMPNRFRF
jgi:hypothetical protein